MSSYPSLPDKPVPVARATLLYQNHEDTSQSYPIVVAKRGVRTAEYPATILFFETADDRLLIGFDTPSREWILIDRIPANETFTQTAKSMIKWAKKHGNRKYGKLDIVAAAQEGLPEFLPE